MNKLTKILIFLLLLSVTITMILLFKYKKISQTAFFIFLFCLIVVELIFLIVAIANNIKKNKPDSGAGSLRDVFDKVNRELATMPDADEMLWEKGKGVTTKTREYSDANGKPQRFIAMNGFTKHTNKEVIVYYNITEDRFWDWVSDPSPSILQDPFYQFQPYSGRGGGLGMENPYANRFGYNFRDKTRQPPININYGQGGYGGGRDRSSDFADNVTFNDKF